MADNTEQQLKGEQKSDQQQSDAGKVVKVGVAQLQNPTPETAKMVFRTILYLSALWEVIAPSVTEIPEATLYSINKYLLLGNAVVNVTIKFFGWDFKS